MAQERERSPVILQRLLFAVRKTHLVTVAETLTHPDIETVSPEEKKANITKGQIEALRTTAYHSAHTAKRRVFIVHDAHTMNPASQNLLLKVLEEPPSDVLFILITTSASLLLETIVSRCIVFSLFAPSFEESLQYLTSACNIPSDEAAALLKEENNNIGKALLRQQDEGDSQGRAVAHDFFDAIEKASPLSAMLYTVPLEKDRNETMKFAEEMSEILIAKIKNTGHLPETAREFIKMYDALCQLTPTLYTNINLSLFFTSLASKMSEAKNK